LRAGGQEVRQDRAEDSADGQSYLVHIQKAGRCVVEQDGRVAVALPGDLVLYDRRRPYKLVLDDPAHEVWVLKVERSELERHVADLRDLTAISVKNATPPVRVLSSMCDVLHSSSHLLDPGSCESMSEAVYSTVSACLRSLPPARVRKNSSLKAYHIARVKAHVNQNLRDPTLSIASIARALQMSPDHLCRLFRDEPQPLSRWLWAQRLDACKRDLCDPRQHRRSISEVAFSWGFNEAAHFSRSFREQFGMSARELRARDAAGVESATNTVTRLRTIGS
jgi:AraC-like DNA-binding protein